MLKKIFILVTILSLLACSPEPLIEVEPVKLTLHSVEKATVEEEAYLLEVIDAAERVLNSEEFQRRLMKALLTNTNGMTNEQVYRAIMNGAELSDPQIDNEFDLNVKFFHRASSGILGMASGTLSPTENYIRFNSYYFGAFRIGSDASTLVHEYTHNLGFKHNGSGEQTSVPYTVGKIIDSLL